MLLSTSLIETLLVSRTAGRRTNAVSGLMPGVAVVIGLTILTAFLLLLLVVSGLYVAYEWLIERGFSELGALGIIDLLIVVVILLLVGGIQKAIDNFKETILGVIIGQAPLASRLIRLGESFLSGLRSPRFRFNRRY